MKTKQTLSTWLLWSSRRLIGDNLLGSWYIILPFLLLFFTSKIYAQDDLYIKDDASDIGNEPHFFPNPWRSPDIVVRNSPWALHSKSPSASATLPAHQNPISNQTNWVYVKIKNRGNQVSRNHQYLKTCLKL